MFRLSRYTVTLKNALLMDGVLSRLGTGAPVSHIVRLNNFH